MADPVAVGRSDTLADRAYRWANDPIYHARVCVVRRWMERAQGAAPDELRSYAMDVIEDLDELEAKNHV